MARYIDAEKLEDGCFPEATCEYQQGWNDALRGAMLGAATADVVPREDYEAVIAGQETLQKYIPKIKAEVAREIIQEIRTALLCMVIANSMGETFDMEKRFAEIEKKYTE